MVSKDERLEALIDLPADNYYYSANDEALPNGTIKEQGAEGDQFDAATFLYDLYKTSTVREIDDFKNTLNLVQKDVVER